MKKRIRLTVLFVCVACFFVVAPILVLYSMGYRFDFARMQVTETGGIYVRTFPAAEQITIDSKIFDKPGIFSNSIFVQSLLPKIHTVLIEKPGYYDYYKNLPVEEGQVTKLENVLLIKKAINFTGLGNNIDYFSAAPNNRDAIIADSDLKNINFKYLSLNSDKQPKNFSISKIPVNAGAEKISDIKWSEDSTKALIKIQTKNNAYYYIFDGASQISAPVRLSYLDKNTRQISFGPQGLGLLFFTKDNYLYSAEGNNALPIINNVAAFKIYSSGITWLSLSGVLYSSDFSGKLITRISSNNFSVDGKNNYEIVLISGNTFLKENGEFFKFDQSTKTFKSFAVPITNYQALASPNDKNLIYWNGEKIYLYSYEKKKYTQIFSGPEIRHCQWLNNDYIIFTSGDPEKNGASKIIISEIDYRGNINLVTLPDRKNLSQMFFNSQDSKLYILTNNTLLSSEKIIP